jgi:membrane fusion protein (multidrug efflux system)
MAIEQVNNQVALLKARVAALHSQQAVRERARADLTRAESLRRTQAISEEELDLRRQAFRVAEAQTREAEQQVFQARVGLGLPAQPAAGAALDQVPENIAQTFSGVRVALADLVQIAAQFGLPLPASNETPQQYLDRFYKNPEGEPIEQLLVRIVNNAPSVLQARAKLTQAERDLDHARLNLNYCEVRARIDGVVSRRSVNVGNTVQAGQQLMAVQSLTDVWVNANFKETQLADLRIGQPVDLHVDMYGDRVTFRGRVAGFAPGTGSTLALLPPENATGNFVKVVQRLPVRIELTEPPAADAPLFVGLSVTPYVHYKEAPTGPNAGQKLQTPIPVTHEPAATPPVSPPAPGGPVPTPAGSTVPTAAGMGDRP